MTDPRTRTAILARRAKFLAAALAATLPACEREKEGIQPDHAGTAHPTDGGEGVMAAPDTRPATAQPCLEYAEPADAGIKPHPCLKMALPRDAGPAPTPHPCLKMPIED